MCIMCALFTPTHPWQIYKRRPGQCSGTFRGQYPEGTIAQKPRAACPGGGNLEAEAPLHPPTPIHPQFWINHNSPPPHPTHTHTHTPTHTHPHIQFWTNHNFFCQYSTKVLYFHITYSCVRERLHLVIPCTELVWLHEPKCEIEFFLFLCQRAQNTSTSKRTKDA